jgi:dethiobiotin synthetase
MRGLFVTGTDTGVGKTVVAASIVAALAADGTHGRVRALKPVITGLEDDYSDDWPADHELLAHAAGASADEVALITYGPPMSPHLAAERSGRPIDRNALRTRVETAVAGDEIAVVEGVGGLLVPLADGYAVRDLAVDLGLPLVVAARPGLGTINHTLLTLEAAWRAGLAIAGVVLTPWPELPKEIECSNRDTLARIGGVEVATLPQLARADPALLRAAGEQLPLAAWLA